MSNDNKIFLDIETLPDDRPATLAHIRTTIKPPGNIKLEASKAKWMAESGEEAAQDRFASTGLDGLYGRICVAGFAVGDRTPIAMRLDAYGSEAVFIERLCTTISNEGRDAHSAFVPLEVVGHNVEFDLKFLFHRAVRYGIQLPRCIRKAFGADARYATHDTMKMWCRYGERVSLKNLARELLGDACDDIDGSEVATMWAKNPDAVVRHCLQDVERTRKLYSMMAAVTA